MYAKFLSIVHYSKETKINSNVLNGWVNKYSIVPHSGIVFSIEEYEEVTMQKNPQVKVTSERS